MLRRQRGFTLIELMIVLAIIGVMAAMAFGQITNAAPRFRLVSRTGEFREEMLRIRSKAVRDYKLYKVCAFVDPTPTDATAHGKILQFSCNKGGDTGCPDAERICTAASDATSGTLYDSAKVETSGCTTANKWCLVSTLDYNSTELKNEKISIRRFLNSTGATDLTAAGTKGLELTYNPSGYISAGRSTASATAGQIEIVNYDLCNDNSATCATGWSRSYKVAYALGGGVRILEF